jgi:GNAT superfamily N-acetyltransferase
MFTLAAEPFDGPDGRSLNTEYFSELRVRFPPGYDPDVSLSTVRDDLEPPKGVFFIVRHGDVAVGCGGLKILGDTTGEVKHMFVRPSHRGRGVGRQILTDIERHARTLGMTRVVLDTNECLTEAIALYERAGYVGIERYNPNPWATHFFAKGLQPET